jgi:hypothetical protein
VRRLGSGRARRVAVLRPAQLDHVRGRSAQAPGHSAAPGANGNGSQHGRGHQKTTTGPGAKHPSPVKARPVRTAPARSQHREHAAKAPARERPAGRSAVAKSRAAAPAAATQHSPPGQQKKAAMPATPKKGPAVTNGGPGG